MIKKLTCIFFISFSAMASNPSLISCDISDESASETNITIELESAFHTENYKWEFDSKYEPLGDSGKQVRLSALYDLLPKNEEDGDLSNLVITLFVKKEGRSDYTSYEGDELSELTTGEAELELKGVSADCSVI